MTTQTAQPFAIRERSTNRFRATFKDEDGVAIPAASLTTVLLTLYDLNDGTVINSRNDQNVLNANNVTIDSSGLLTWEMQVNDTVLTDETLTPPGQKKLRRALFEYTYASGAKANNSEFDFEIQSIKGVGTI